MATNRVSLLGVSFLVFACCLEFAWGEDWMWRFQKTGLFESSPAIGADGTIYVGCDDGRIYAVRPDGTELGSYNVGVPVGDSSPTVGADGTVYFGASDGRLRAVTSGGVLKWSYLTHMVYGAPAIGRDGTIYAGSSDGRLYAFRSDGALRWFHQAESAIHSSPAIGPDGTIYIGSVDRRLYALCPDGSLKWSYKTGRLIESSAAVAEDGTIYFGSTDSNLYALSGDGSLKWSYTTGGGVNSSPAIGEDGAVYFGSDDKKVYAVNPDGSLKWSYATGEAVYSSPLVITGGIVCVGSDDGKVYGFSANGSLVGTFDAGYRVFTSQAITKDGILYVTAGNSLYALDTDTAGGPAASPWPMYGHDVCHTGRSSLPSTVPATLVFAQYANGESGGARNRTRVVLRNGGSWEESGQITFRDNQGKPVKLPLNGESVSTVDYRIPPWGTLELQTDGTGTLQTGVVEVASDQANYSQLTGTEIFDILGHFVSLDSSPPITSQHFYVSSTAAENTGLAFYNLSRSETVEVDLRLLDASGAERATQVVTMQPGQHLARFVDETELFSSYFQTHPGQFKGTIELQARYKKQVVAVGLIQKRSTGALMAVPGQSTNEGYRWFHPTNREWVTSSPAIGEDGTIYVSGHDDNLYALYPDGALKWLSQPGPSLQSPAIGPDGTVYIGGSNGKLYAFSPEGGLRWTFDTGGSVTGCPSVAADGTIYFGSATKVYAVTPGGSRKWSFDTGLLVQGGSVAVASDGTIYVCAGQLFALRADGSLKWSYSKSYNFYSSPAIGADGTVLLNCSGIFYAVRPDGTLRWSYSTTPSAEISSAAVAVDGTIYFGADKFYALKPDGSLKWSYETPAAVGSTPAVGSNGTIYFGCRDSQLYALSPDGKLKWSHPTGYWISSSPVIGPDGMIYVGSDDSRIYAFSTGTLAGPANSAWPMFQHDARHSGRARDVTELPNLVFPQYANGEAGGMPNRTRVILRNPSTIAQGGQIRFQDNQGKPATIPIGGQGVSSTNYQLAALGSVEVQTDGTGALQTGSVEVAAALGSGAGLEGAEIFEILGHIVSLGSAQLRASHQAYVTVTGNENTGIAAYNPDRSEAVTLDLVLVDEQGTERAQQQLKLQPRQQMARFVDEPEMFSVYFASHPGDFKGTVNVQVREDMPVALTGLIQRRDTGALIAVATSPDTLIH